MAACSLIGRPGPGSGFPRGAAAVLDVVNVRIMRNVIDPCREIGLLHKEGVSTVSALQSCRASSTDVFKDVKRCRQRARPDVDPF